ncbi:MAG: primosomal protein [SAR324 cluster bacterium]|uniref:Primosomal protein n=1 Tax=SAR324 cluster bacterium TaxID=2024889 RepID=A0A432GVX5_9DELT|nr:tetratricopeptide repeat protein [SAR324 cluster bacterium]RTZ87720.1 MAG: primosomal protein [SAR324 cluster bacterium]
MRKNTISGDLASLFSLLIICFLTFYFGENASAKETSDGKDESQVEDPSPEKAEEAAEKKQSLEELLAVPFKLIKEEQDEDLGQGGKNKDNKSKSNNGEVKLPPPPEQRKVERDLEKKIDIIFREVLPKDYVGVTVSIRYILETVPVTKVNKSISKVKLPGFENNVWVPTQSKKIIGIVNQVRPYTTIFAVVNTPVSLFNVEVIRQILDERIRFLNLTGRDVLRMVHVPFTTPAQSSVNTLDNAAAELAKKEDGDEKVGEDEKVDGEEKEERIEDKELKEDKDGGETDDKKPDAGEGELELAEQKKDNETLEDKPEAILEPDPEPRRIDQKTRVETARYLLQVRKAYLKEDYDAAITALRRAIELNPFSSQAFAMLGSVYYRLGWNRMAIENWQHSLELDPTNEGLKKYLMRLSR